MQSLDANCLLEAKNRWLNCDSGSLHVTVEEKWIVPLSQNGWFFLILYHSYY